MAVRHSSAGPTGSCVGNDVMDLLDPRCRDRSADDPLLDRILAAGERDWIEAAGTRVAWSIRLWALWAAKESAFKVQCKLSPGRPFVPRNFSCQLQTDADADNTVVRIQGSVTGLDAAFPVVVEGSSNRSYVHVVGWDGTVEQPRSGRIEVGVEELELEGQDSQLEELRSRFTSAEWEGIYSLSSARARLLARERIRKLLASPQEGSVAGVGREVDSVEILTQGDRQGQSPPRILAGGRDIAGLDLSLSHHGRFVAWALLIRE